LLSVYIPNPLRARYPLRLTQVLRQQGEDDISIRFRAKSQIAVMMAALLLKGRFAFHLAGTVLILSLS